MKIVDEGPERCSFLNLKPGDVFKFAKGYNSNLYMKLDNLAFWCLNENRYGCSLPTSNDELIKLSATLTVRSVE